MEEKILSIHPRRLARKMAKTSMMSIPKANSHTMGPFQKLSVDRVCLPYLAPRSRMAREK